MSRIGRRPCSRGTPKGPGPDSVLAGLASRAQSRPLASEQLSSPNVLGDHVCRTSARQVERGVDVIALAPSFIYLQWACNRSRGSERAVRSRSRCNLGRGSGVAAGRSSHLQRLQSAAKPRGFRAVLIDSGCCSSEYTTFVLLMGRLRQIHRVRCLQLVAMRRS